MKYSKDITKLLASLDGGNVTGFMLTINNYELVVQQIKDLIEKHYFVNRLNENSPRFRNKPIQIGNENRAII